jgi:hypothetical protein
MAGEDADRTEEETEGGEGEGDREADQEEQNEGAEHQRRHHSIFEHPPLPPRLLQRLFVFGVEDDIAAERSDALD